jgi:uncharacterized membrane protein
MALVGRLHPLLIHFPIALVIGAAAAESAATITADHRWRMVAVGNLRAGAIFAVLAAIAGWRLALEPAVETASLLEWHRWLGIIGAGMAIAAALASSTGSGSPVGVRIYRTTLFAAATFLAVTAHFGGLLVWGANFLRP